MQAYFFQPGSKLGPVFQDESDLQVAGFVVIMFFFIGVGESNLGTLGNQSVVIRSEWDIFPCVDKFILTVFNQPELGINRALDNLDGTDVIQRAQPYYFKTASFELLYINRQMSGFCGGQG